jgi:hypothetical protein
VLSCQDLDGDGLIDLTLIEGCFPDHPSGRIRVYDRGRDMQCGATWQDSVDFEDDLWVFDADGDDEANLIIDFHRDPTGLFADLYDDQDGDGAVAHEMISGVPEVTESEHWTLRVIAPDGWWIRDSRVNLNLQLFVDGSVRGAFDATVYTHLLSTDGVTDFDIMVRDTDVDGRPDYELNQ